MKRGPKPKPEQEKKVLIRVWVKKKHFSKAKKEADDLQRKYDTEKSNKVS